MQRYERTMPSSKLIELERWEEAFSTNNDEYFGIYDVHPRFLRVCSTRGIRWGWEHQLWLGGGIRVVGVGVDHMRVEQHSWVWAWVWVWYTTWVSLVSWQNEAKQVSSDKLLWEYLYRQFVILSGELDLWLVCNVWMVANHKLPRVWLKRRRKTLNYLSSKEALKVKHKVYKVCLP